jgi:hypothetical protein
MQEMERFKTLSLLPRPESFGRHRALYLNEGLPTLDWRESRMDGASVESLHPCHL